tara:strand:- start:360 stop:977 length:618 start_codon:yes stop_codon:yes gene_type:complete
MALVRVTLGGKRLGYVRNNKAGSTTIINYLGQLLWNEKPTFHSGTNIQNHCGRDSYIGREKGFESYHQELKECEIRIAVYRDPIDKIITGFYYCQEQYPHLNNLDLFLDTYEHQLKNNYIRIHCRTNTDMLGPDPSIYTHVWNMKEIDSKLLPFLEQLGGKKIQKTRLREHEPRTITEAQKVKAKEVMAIDYQNGWCNELISSKI